MFRRASASIKKYFKQADIFLLCLTLIICAFGLVLIYSATKSYERTNFITVQLFGILLGVVLFIVASLVDFERFPRMWIVFFVINILFQLSLKFLGTAGDTGNKSWIRFGPIGIQPGQVGTIIFIYTFASHINMLKNKLNSPLSVLQLVLHAGITMGSVYIFSHDLGVTLIYVFITISMLFASGISAWWLGGMALSGCGVAPLLWRFLSESQKLRILVVFDPDLSPAKAWHAKQSMIALGNGGLFGKGLFHGTQTQSSMLYGKHTDFIFAACGEELGFVGCAILLLLLAVLVIRVFYNATRASTRIGYLMCVGIGGMLMFQILINVGMCAGVMPVIGLTLPLVSYSGTSVMVTIASLGFVSGFVMRRKPSWLR